MTQLYESGELKKLLEEANAIHPEEEKNDEEKKTKEQ